MLDAQRRLADAGSGYYRAVVDFNRALADVHYARGTLLDYDGVFLTEGPWPIAALRDAARQSSRTEPMDMNYCFSKQYIIGAGTAPQLTLPPPADAQRRIASSNRLPELVPTPQRNAGQRRRAGTASPPGSSVAEHRRRRHRPVAVPCQRLRRAT